MTAESTTSEIIPFAILVIAAFIVFALPAIRRRHRREWTCPLCCEVSSNAAHHICGGWR